MNPSINALESSNSSFGARKIEFPSEAHGKSVVFIACNMSTIENIVLILGCTRQATGHL